jgi:hypothetical protein
MDIPAHIINSYLEFNVLDSKLFGEISEIRRASGSAVLVETHSRGNRGSLESADPA